MVFAIMAHLDEGLSLEILLKLSGNYLNCLVGIRRSAVSHNRTTADVLL
jgi:hypothetical protein